MPRSSSLLGRCWILALEILFLLLCLRAILATLLGAGVELWPSILVVVGSWFLGSWNPKAGLFAFASSLPLFSGLYISSLLPLEPVSNLVFASMYLGFSIRSLTKRNSGPRFSAEIGQRIPILILNVLITAVMVSLGFAVFRRAHSALELNNLLTRIVFGFGDPNYFLQSASLWIEGLFLCRTALILFASGNEAERRAAAQLRPLFVIYAVSAVAFFIFQFISKIPEPLAGHAYYLPFEDISSFGSINAAIFIFLLCTVLTGSRLYQKVGVLLLLLSLAMVVVSWSRAAWLGCMIFASLAILLRFHRKAFGIFCLLGAILVAVVIFNSSRDSWIRNPYSSRLISLVKIENPANKSPQRVELYRKAVSLIRTHPIVGNGIGSFYLSSVRYAEQWDPNGAVPDFAHNTVLQVAAEMGLPFAALLFGLIAWSLSSGYKYWRTLLAIKPVSPEAFLIASDILGATLAIGVYLETQLTANSLNVYSSNQFFFWFITAILVSDVIKRPTANKWSHV